MPRPLQHRPIIVQLQVCLPLCHARDRCPTSARSSTFADYIASSNSTWPASTALRSTSTAAPPKLAALAGGSVDMNIRRLAAIGQGVTLGTGCAFFILLVLVA